MAKAKKLARDKSDKVLTGLLGGVAKYFQIDSTLVRVTYLISLAVTGVLPGIVIYALASLVVPKAR